MFSLVVFNLCGSFWFRFLWVANAMSKCRTRGNSHVNGIITMQMMGWNKGYTMDLPQWRVCNVKISVHGV